MSDRKQTGKNLLQVVPGGGIALVAFAVIALIAFSLGFFISPTSHKAGRQEKSAQSEKKAKKPTIWTCSMHPQIRLPKPGKCPICFMDLIPLEDNLADENAPPRQLRMSATAKKLAQIQTIPVMKAFKETTIHLTGKIDYDETKMADITARFPGRFDSLKADYTGMPVQKGDLLGSLYAPQVISTQEELIQAVRTYASTDSKILRQTAEDTRLAARERLRQWGLTEKQIDKIESRDKPQEYISVYSPITGTVIEKNVLEGQYVNTGTKLYTITDLSSLWLQLEAFESDLVWLRIGQTVTFTSPSYPGEQFTAKISFIDPTVQAGNRTIRVRANINNTDGRLKPEMLVSAEIHSWLDKNGRVLSAKTATTASSKNAPLLIPASAPLITGTRAIVYIEKPSQDGPVFEGREIELGPRAGNFYIVKSGVAEGELVVVNGAFKIDSELQIQAKPSMMSPEESPAPAGRQHGLPTKVMQKTITAPMSMPDSQSSQIKEQVTPQAVRALTPVYNAYFSVQMNLANDRLDSTVSAYRNLISAVKQVDMTLFGETYHHQWMTISKEIIKQTERGTNANDFETARDVFYYLSQSMITLQKTFGHAEKRNFYTTFCPMARNNKGAHWLQTENIVWNSFYGNKMLRCGEIQDSVGSQLHEEN